MLRVLLVIAALVCVAVLLVRFVGAARAAEPTPPAPPPAPLELPGSEVRLPLEPGFVLAENFVGVWNVETDASVMVTRMDAPASEVIPHFTPAALAAQGLSLGMSDVLALDTRSGVWMEGTQGEHLVCLALVGDSRHTWLLKGSARTLEARAPLERMMRGATWGELVPARLAFTMEAPLGMPFVEDRMGARLFTVDGQMGEAAGKAVLVVVPSVRPLPRSEETARAQFDRISGIIGLKADEVRTVSHEGLDGWDVEGHGLDDRTGDEMVVWQRMLFDAEGRFFRMVGMAPRAQAHRWVRSWEKAAGTLRLEAR